MLFDDTYKEITSNRTAIYKEKGSKFIGYSFLVKSISDVKKNLEEIKTIHKSANHHCYGYMLYADKSMFKFNDDREPASTAGKQILRQIQKFELTNILIIVVRYFGGIKLGIPGLIRSYKTTAKLTIEDVKIVEKDITEQYILTFKYSELNHVMRLVKKHNLNMIESDLKNECKIKLLIPKKTSKLIIDILKKNHKLTITYQ